MTTRLPCDNSVHLV